MTLPAASEVVTKLQDLGRGGRGVPLHDVAKLVSARQDYLHRLIDRNELIRVDGQTLNVTTDSALSLVPKFLPRILGWKTVATLGEEMGIHRNTIESMVNLHGKVEMIRLCRDNCLYISPEGEAFVKERKKALEVAETLEPLSEFVKRLGVPLNHVTAFFSARSSPFLLDIHGRARVSEEQKALYLQHRAQLERRRRHDDILIDGKPFRSIARVAAEQASLFSKPGTSAHKSLSTKLFGIVRYFSDSSDVARKTDLGLYIPVQVAEILTDSLSLSDASKALGVPRAMISSWRRRDRSIAPPTSPRIRHRGVSLSGVVEAANKRFREDVTLSSLDNVPTILSSLPINQVAKRLGSSFSQVVAALPVPPTDVEVLENRLGALSRSTHQIVSAILRPETGQRVYVPLTEECLRGLQSNAPQLGLSTSELLDLALSRKVATRCSTEHLPLKIHAPRYSTLLRLGLVSSSAFADSRIVPASNALELLSQWSERNKVHLKTAASILGLSSGEQSNLLQGSGEVLGSTVLKVVALTRMTGESARQRYPVQFVNGPRYEEPSARAHPLAAWGKSMTEVPALNTVDELHTFLNQKGPKGPDLKDGCLSSALIATLITKVAQARNVSPEKVYGFVSELLRPNGPWLPTYGEFRRVAKEGIIPLRFTAIVGKCLLDISDPKVVVYAYQQGRAKPNVGDIFVHSHMHDYGTVRRLDQGEGGTVAVVEMVLNRRSLSFRV